MVFVPHERRSPGLLPVKIIISGGFGVGKTTFVASVSEIEPLTTEAALTTASLGVDDTAGLPGKTTTTVAMDFGRMTLTGGLILYLFGTPGQDRFWFMWDDLSLGSVGAVVLADTRRLGACFPAIDYFEDRGVPFIVAVNCFHGVADIPLDVIRDAMALPEAIPIVRCDARDAISSKDTLVRLVEHALALAEDPAGMPVR